MYPHVAIIRAPMNQIDPDDEAMYILEILSENPGLQLREIHDLLAGRSKSGFKHSPSTGNGYNIEQYLVKGLVEYLNKKKELITADGSKWSLTVTGRREITS